MQGRDEKDRAETPQDELLEEAFNACMDEQLSFIPPEREIARMHTFSESFKEAMAVLLKTKGKPERRQITKREFVYSFNKMAACILAVLVVGGACVGGLALLSRSSSGKQAEAPAMDMAEDTGEAAGAEVGMEAASPESEEEAAAEPTEEENTEFPEEAEFCGSKIHLAAAQYLPEKTDNVKTLINSPVIARDAKSVMITIGNMKEQPIYYYKNMDLEVFIDGAWYLVPSKQVTDEEAVEQMVMLEPEMAQDEELFLEYYDLDYEAEKYRVVTYLDGLILSSEFRFENPVEDLEAALESGEE